MITAKIPDVSAPERVLYHHRTQGKAVEGVHIRGVTDALRARAIAVDVISLPGADPYAPDRAASPTTQTNRLAKWVARLPEPLFELAELGYNAIVAVRIWRTLRARSRIGYKGADFIYERYSMYMFATVLIARMRGIPIILEINDSAFVDRVRHLQFKRIAAMIERWVFRRANGLVFVSTTLKERIGAQVPGMAPSIVTHNAANIDKFSFTPEQRASARAQYGLDDHVVCGYLGAFVPWHAIDKFVFEIADTLKTNPTLKLLLVGDGATFESVRRFVAERGLGDQVVLTGRVRHADVPGLLAAMDIAILPSAGDYTSPVKLFEFMACAVPPLAPDFPPIREVLQPGVTGWMFKAGDLREAVQSLLKLSQDPRKLCEVGANARAYIERERQWDHNIAQLLAFHRQVR